MNLSNNKSKENIEKKAKKIKDKTGISFIILVVTIIVSLILLSVVVLSINDRNVLKQSSETKFKADIKVYQTELQDYISNEEFNNNGRYNNSLYADLGIVKYEGVQVGTITIKDVIPSITTTNITKFIVSDSKLVYIGEDSVERAWASSLIEVKDVSNTAYVQDNLILNLDGATIPDSDTWKDVSTSGNDMSYLVNYTYDSNAKCYNFSSGTAITSKDIILSQNYTIEIVLNLSAYEDMFLGLNSSDNSNLLQLKTEETTNSIYWNNGSSINWSQKYPIKPTLNKNISLVLVNNYLNSTGSMYFNNTKYSLNVDNLNITSKFLIGNALSTFSGKIYAIRVYDKALSDEELTSNYELDKIRFSAGN